MRTFFPFLVLLLAQVSSAHGQPCRRGVLFNGHCFKTKEAACAAANCPAHQCRIGPTTPGQVTCARGELTVTATGVGPIQRGVTVTEIPRLTGLKVTPTKPVRKTPPERWDVLRGQEKLLWLDTEKGKTHFISVESPALKTKEGTGVGTSARKLKSLYGELKHDYNPEGEYCVEFAKASGIQFCFALSSEGSTWAQVLRQDLKVSRMAVPPMD